MADPFGIAQGLAGFLNISVTFAGYMLGMMFSVGLMITLEWTIGSRAGGRGSDVTLFVSAILGIIASTLFGWFDAWVVVFAMITLGIVGFALFKD